MLDKTTSARARVFLLTFVAYTLFHYVRKTPSVLKAVLRPSNYDRATNPGWDAFARDLDYIQVRKAGLVLRHDARFDGHYACADYHGDGENASDGADERADDFAPCRVYAREVEPSSFIAKLDHAHPTCLARDTLNPNHEACWVVMSNATTLPRLRRSMRFPKLISLPPPAYVQFNDGDIPRPVDKNKPASRAWYRRVVQEVEGAASKSTYEATKRLIVAPNLTDGKLLLGILDTGMVLAYSFGLFASGYAADRYDIRRFLGWGMVVVALLTACEGLAFDLKFRSFTYLLVLSILSGAAQSTGWPSVVTVMSRWFPKSMRNRGLILGVWNSHISIGNILGSIGTTAVVHASSRVHHHDWAAGYYSAATFMVGGGALVLLFLEPHPEPDSQGTSVHSPLLLAERRDAVANDGNEEEERHLGRDAAAHDEGIRAKIARNSLVRALAIPGVLGFSICLFFCKLCSYALMFWGPYYLNANGFSSERAGYLCSFFDVGGLLGSVAAGLLSDRTPGRGLAAALFLLAACPIVLVYHDVTNEHLTDVGMNVWMMTLVGFFINGPVGLITTAVSADLGNHPSLRGDESLRASVAGVIDGVGSLGAALQGVLLGYVSADSWSSVFRMLSFFCLLAALSLWGIVREELLGFYRRRRGGGE